MRPGTHGNDKCLDGYRACICDYGMGAVRIEFNIEQAPCKDLPPVATERTSQRLDEREWVRAMAMIWKPHGPLEDRGQRRLKLPSGARTSKVTPRRWRRSIASRSPWKTASVE